MRNLLLAAVCMAPFALHAQTLNSNNNNGGSNGNGNANANLNANTNTLTAGAASRSVSRASSRAASRSNSQAVTGPSTSASTSTGGAGYGYGGSASANGSSGNVTSFQDRLQAPAVSAPAIITSNGCAGSPISAGVSFQGVGAQLGLGNGFDGACRIEAAMNNPVAREFLCLQSGPTRQAIKNMALEGLVKPCHDDLAEVSAALAKAQPVAVVEAPRYTIKPDWCGTWAAADGPLPDYCR